jgi:hypothetical protein
MAQDLSGTATDVRNVRRTLAAFGFEGSTTTELFDSKATGAAVRRALDDMAAKVGSEDIFVLYMSGHGMPKPFGSDGMSMPLFFDSNASDSGSMDYDELTRRFSQIRARELLLVIDTCYSGWATTTVDQLTLVVSSQGAQVKHAGGAPDLSRFAHLPDHLPATGFAIMTAARPDETSNDLGSERGGLFTYNLLQSLADTHGQMPLDRLYKEKIWPSVVNGSLRLCRQADVRAVKNVIRKNLQSCKQQSPVLGYLGAGNLITLAKPGAGDSAQ